MLVKNRCFELFEQSENCAKFAVLFFHVGICSFSRCLFIPMMCKTLWEICPKRVGVARDLKRYTNNCSAEEM